MEPTAVVKAVKKVRMINSSKGPKDVFNDVVVSMTLVAVSIVARVKRVATLAKVVMESLKAVARRMFVMEDRIAMVLDDTSVAISEVVEVVVAAAVEVVVVVDDVNATKKAVKVDHRKMDKMEVVNREDKDVATHVSVVQCVGRLMAMLMVLR